MSGTEKTHAFSSNLERFTHRTHLARKDAMNAIHAECRTPPAGSKEIDPVRRQAVRMLGSIAGQGVRELGEMITWDRMGNKQDTGVGTLVGEELNGEANKIVSIPGHETAAFLGCPLQLLPVGPAKRAHFVRADGVKTPSAEDLGDGGAQVLVEVEPHEGLTAKVGCWRTSRSFVQRSLRAMARSISFGYAAA